MLARDLGLGRAERDLLSTEPRIEEITARGSPDKILTSRLTDDAPFRGERTRSSWMSGPRAGNGTRVLRSRGSSRSRFRVLSADAESSRNRRMNHVKRFAGTAKLKGQGRS